MYVYISTLHYYIVLEPRNHRVILKDIGQFLGFFFANYCSFFQITLFPNSKLTLFYYSQFLFLYIALESSLESSLDTEYLIMPIRTSTIHTSVNMCFWNTGGLMSKTNDKTTDPLFLKEIDKYDLVFLAETHLGYDANICNIGSFHCHTICRPASKHNKRHFGGLAILRKTEIKPYVKI